MAGYNRNTPSYSYSRDRAKDRNRRAPSRLSKQELTGDVIISALTMQVIICVILILTSVVFRKTNEVKYLEFKSELSSLTDGGDGTALTSLFADAGKGFSNAIQSFEEFLGNILDGFLGTEHHEENPLPDNNGNEAESEESETEITQGYDYNYLKDNAIFTSTGAGGLSPVNMTLSEPLSAPGGSTLTPVMLTAKLRPPLSGLITSRFGYRDHPVSGESDFHTGLDIGAEEGTAILAVLPGEVVEIGESSIYGKYIVLKHAMNLKTSYSHCSEIIAKEGMAVRQGERIAKVGHTGVATGPHLHFSVIVDEEFTDPYWVLKDDIQLVEE